MPAYHVFHNGLDTGNVVTGTSYVDAYFNAASFMPLSYQHDIVLKEVDQDDRH